MYAPPEMVDMNRNRVRFQFVVHAVELLLEYRSGDHAAESSHQQLEDRKLLTAQRDRCRVDADVAANSTKSQVPRLESHAQRMARPAQQRLDARNQFDHGKGFDHVVIGPGVKAADPLFYRIAR